MRPKKIFSLSLNNQRPVFIATIIMACVLIALTSGDSFAQRGLGFKGMVPPSNAKPKKYTIKVDELDLPLIRAIDDEGAFVKVFLGPYYFFRERGFEIQKGQSLIIWAVPMKVEGSKVLVSFKIKDKDTKTQIVLRNSKGEPIWWGAGGRPNKQNDKKQGR